MKFTKMQGCGNDYIYVNCFTETVPDPSAAAIRLSDRHFGIGGDGLVLICPSDAADFCMEMYNADGSRSEMCGNAIRCVGKCGDEADVILRGGKLRIAWDRAQNLLYMTGPAAFVFDGTVTL